MGKFWIERCVCAPQYREDSTSIVPIVSDSIRKLIETIVARAARPRKTTHPARVYHEEVKVAVPLLAVMLAGCGVSVTPRVSVGTIPTPPTPIRLIQESRQVDEKGKLTGIEYTWDLGGREYKMVKCAGFTSVSGVQAGTPLTSILRVGFKAGKGENLNLVVHLDQKNHATHTGSSTESGVKIDGGVSGIKRTPDEKLTGNTVTLLTWKATDKTKPAALIVEFR